MTATATYVIATTKTGTRVHKSTCKRVASAARSSASAALHALGNGATPATCCKPSLKALAAEATRQDVARAARDAKAAADGTTTATKAPKAPRALRVTLIPVEATEHKCTGCAKVLPLTSFPTYSTREGLRRKTECRACRNARYAG